jgi:membrane-bound ClpP family serine protease
MPLITLVVTLIVVGVLLYLLEVYVPMDATIKRIIHIVVIIAVVLWLLSAFGILQMASNVQVPRVR